MPGPSPSKYPASEPVLVSMTPTSTWVAVTPGTLPPDELPVVVVVDAAVVVVVAVEDADEHPAPTTATTASDATGTTQFPRRPRISSSSSHRTHHTGPGRDRPPPR